MKAEVTKIETKKSHRGGYFKYVFFKSLVDGKSYRSCISDEFRNYKYWVNVKVGQILDNLIVRDKIVDADSDFRIVNPAIPDEVNEQKERERQEYIEKKRNEIFAEK